MKVFQTMEETGCEQVVFCYDKATGLKAIIAIHDTTFGTAIGGCRMRNYPGEEEAFTDAVRPGCLSGHPGLPGGGFWQ